MYNLDSKAGVYKSVIGFQKKHGQGLSGIVKLGNGGYQTGLWLDELIEEGLVEACHTGGSIGHPESNIFYMPTKGYNVWKDDGVDGEYCRFKGRYLTNVRYYLGGDNLSEDKPNRTDNEKVLQPTFTELSRNPEFMKQYAEWLERNHKELEIMVNLDDYYDEPDFSFTDVELEWIKSKDWYKNNLPIKECYELSRNVEDNDIKRLGLHKQLISLYDKAIGYDKDRQKGLKEIEQIEKELEQRKRLHNWFDKQDMNRNIQTVL